MLTNMLLTGNWSLIRVRALSLTVIACINRALFIAVFFITNLMYFSLCCNDSGEVSGREAKYKW